jgi:outer membrane lipoprotein SlyB
MRRSHGAAISAIALATLVFMADAAARTTVEFGRITAVRQGSATNQGAQSAGRLVGGALGVASGSGQSRSNRALRGVGGAAVGGAVAGAASSTTVFEYTVLIGGTRTITFVSEKAGLRVGDCVSIERGNINNIRLEADERCETSQGPASDREISDAYACEAATQQLINANTDEEFDRAERRVRLLCN